MENSAGPPKGRFLPNSATSEVILGCSLGLVGYKSTLGALLMEIDLRGPLAGIRVLDASRVLAGPYCGQVLGDLGAEVIKIERPGGGDETRAWGPPFAGPLSAYYLSCNRNKRAITLDLSRE